MSSSKSSRSASRYMSITVAGGLPLEDGPHGLCERAEGVGRNCFPFRVHVNLNGGLYGIEASERNALYRVAPMRWKVAAGYSTFCGRTSG